jgi:hypothetical protein
MEPDQFPEHHRLIELAGSEENVESWRDYVREWILPNLDQPLEEFEYEGDSELGLLKLLEVFDSLGLSGSKVLAPRAIEGLDSLNEVKFTNLEVHELAREILNNVSSIYFWANCFLRLGRLAEEGGELFDLEVSIEDHFFSIAVLHLKPEEFPIANQEFMEDFKINTVRKVSMLLNSYHLELISHGLPIMADLFGLLHSSPDTLDYEAMQFVYAPDSSKFFSKEAKDITAMLGDISERLSVLENKIADLSR